ncbi:hypothetical protein PY365_09515 [Roseiarcaceae bacterium H3SJ34-1]|uniref:hypothetical protein n=1 Tax=Terripilifer ovatus TaxID=3032367 RepID=UPI003AB98EAE|nr:hypothetical protein [Roseiarcaceae bacterium H3SJ34-1]
MSDNAAQAGPFEAPLVDSEFAVTNPAASVRDPKQSVIVGKTPVLETPEARELLDSIDVSTPIGLRDRAFIGLMVYSFACVGAAVGDEGLRRVCAEPPLVGAAAIERIAI